MTNPNNAIGTNAAYNGRTSVNAVNDVLASFSGRGVLSGWAVAPTSGLTLQLGGNAGIRDVAIAQDNNGNRTTINNISGAPISITLPPADPEAPRVDAIVAYVENPAAVDPMDYIIDSPEICGLIVVSDTSVQTPDDAKIRAAITDDGVDGAKAYYVVLGTVFVGAGSEQIPAGDIQQGPATSADNSDIVISFDNFTIDPSAWTELGEGYSPYTVQTTVTTTIGVDAKTTVELINDQAVLFANYGFAIGEVDGQEITFYALKTPETSVSLTIEARTNYPDVLAELRKLNSGTGAEENA